MKLVHRTCGWLHLSPLAGRGRRAALAASRVRGTLKELGGWRAPLTRPPSRRRRRSAVDLSPQAGRGWESAAPLCTKFIETRSSAPNPKFAHILLQVRLRTSEAGLAKGRQQAFGCFQIRRIRALDELLEDRLQKPAGAFGSSLTGQQRCQIDCGT
jgi:hypothetical protein